MQNPVIYSTRCGDRTPQCYELVRRHTTSVYGSGREGFGIQFKSDPTRYLISDEFVWFEGPTAEFDREAAIAALVK